ncbi:MAG: hypothetical protein LBF97_06120 [Elusimicrobiota bacterium]|jgi:hypothetical protein|nr:hypothetical protein [Elusimicrobiota bacterium]
MNKELKIKIEKFVKERNNLEFRARAKYLGGFDKGAIEIWGKWNNEINDYEVIVTNYNNYEIINAGHFKSFKSINPNFDIEDNARAIHFELKAKGLLVIDVEIKKTERKEETFEERLQRIAEEGYALLKVKIDEIMSDLKNTEKILDELHQESLKQTQELSDSIKQFKKSIETKEVIENETNISKFRSRAS